MKQSTWLRIDHSGARCLRLALRTLIIIVIIIQKIHHEQTKNKLQRKTVQYVKATEHLFKRSACPKNTRRVYKKVTNLVLAVHAGNGLRQTNHTLQLTYSDTPSRPRSTCLISLPQTFVFFHDVVRRVAVYLHGQQRTMCLHFTMSVGVL